MIVVLGGLALGREGWGELGAGRKRAGRDGQRRRASDGRADGGSCRIVGGINNDTGNRRGSR